MGYKLLHFTNHQILKRSEFVILTIKTTIKGFKSQKV
ncbi:MAG: hypothetical protein IPJ75_16325 [Ignavibacteriales bacterium]|nr:hypothetical protein [Ignavibacteriales bacterium]